MVFGWFSGKPAKSADVLEAERAFTEGELHAITTQFNQAAQRAGSDPKNPSLNQKGFLVLLGLQWLDAGLATQLYHLVLRGHPDGLIRVEDVIVAKAKLERSSDTTAQEFCYSLLDTQGSGSVSQQVLEIAISTAVQLSFAGQPGVPAPAPAHVTAVALGCLQYDGSEDGSSKGLTFQGYHKLTKACPALHNSLASLLSRVGTCPTSTSQPATSSSDLSAAPHTAAGQPAGSSIVAHGAGLPQLLQLGSLSMQDTLLQPVWLWALCSCLAPALRKEWRLLFNSHRDGKSFSTFFGRLQALPGPTLLLVRDKGGHLFCGFAPQPWVKNGNFYGNVTSFIASLEPVMRVYPATGINQNIQWCGVGFTQLPSGIGLGGAQGAQGHFALYLDSSLDTGMSRPIATYGNPSLSSQQVFQVDSVECWLLAPPEEEDLPPSSKKGSSNVLDKTGADQAFMSLAGMQMHSAGVRGGGGRPEDDL